MPPGDRMTRAPPARSSGECSPDRLRSSGDPTLGFRRKGTDLNSAIRSGGAAGRPIERRVNRGEVEDYESPKLLFRIKQRTIPEPSLFFPKSHPGSSLRGFQWIALLVDARVYC